VSDNIVKIKNVRCTRATAKAILVEGGDLEESPIWVPQSQVHADSEVWKEGDVGALVVTAWFAEQRGWL
jgi:hypothetical protein